MKKLFVLLLSCVMAFGVLAGCGGSSSGGGVISILLWDDESNLDYVEDLLNDYIQREYTSYYKKAPTVKIEYIPQTEQKAIERLGNLGPTGNGPDVFAFVHNQIGAALGSKWIAPITYDDSVKAHHSEQAVAALTLGDRIYGYPSTGETMVLMYDADQLGADDIVSLESIYASGKKISWQIDEDAYYSFAFMTDANVFGTDGTDQTSLKLDNEQSIKNLAYLYDKNSDIYKAIISETPDESLDSIRTQRSAGVATTPYLWPSFKQLVESIGGTPKVAVLPNITVDGQEVTLRPYAGFKAYGVSAFTEYPHLSQAIAHYLSTADCQIRRFYETESLPTLTDSAELDKMIAASEAATVYQTMMERTITMPNIVRMEDMWAPGETALTSLYSATSVTADLVKSKLEAWQQDVLSKNA